MKQRVYSWGILAGTLLLLALLVAVDPFQHAIQFLDKVYGAAPEWTLVGKVYVDPQTQETSHGEDPVPSFRRLSEYWSRRAATRHVYLVGNSQMYTVLLAPGEQLSDEVEKTYPDLLNDFYRAHDRNVSIYRLAAPNITYMEALWYLVYLTEHRELEPNTLVLQLNYETFRKTGIRDGMLSMLDDAKFFSAIDKIARSDRPYSSLFLMALQKHKEQIAKVGKATGNDGTGEGMHTGIVESASVGNRIETDFRDWLDRVPGFSRRLQMKGEFEGLLYRARVFLLHIKPTTPRSLSEATLVLNRSAVDDIANLCRERKIELVLVNAPQNPSALLYKTAADHNLYEETIRSIANLHGLTLYDFESVIPAASWGVWIDGPDPIHFGRHGHDLMTKIMIDHEVVAKQMRPPGASQSSASAPTLSAVSGNY
jgi:hypothetical protein